MFAPLIALLLSLAPDSAEVDGFRRTSPVWGARDEPMTAALAAEHIAAARAGVAAAGLGPDFVFDALAIAHHESRYTFGKVEREPPGCHKGVCRSVRFSCGVMTPEPSWARCPSGRTLAEEYEEGARHLGEWLAICGGNRLCALAGYSGHMRDNQSGNAGLFTWQVFARRAAWIRAEMKARPRATPPTS